MFSAPPHSKLTTNLKFGIKQGTAGYSRIQNRWNFANSQVEVWIVGEDPGIHQVAYEVHLEAVEEVCSFVLLELSSTSLFHMPV